MLFFTNDGDLKRKNSPTASPFWPQRDLSVIEPRVDASGQPSVEKSDPMFFLGENHSKRYWSTVAPENEEHLGREN